MRSFNRTPLLVAALIASACAPSTGTDGGSGTDGGTGNASDAGLDAGALEGTWADCPAPDLLSHGFDDGTLGGFSDNLDAFGQIVADPTAVGGHSVEQQWFRTGPGCTAWSGCDVEGTEQSSGIDAEFSPTQVLYVRWAYKEDSTFDNSGIKKVLLPRAPGFGKGSGILTVYQDRFNWDFVDDMVAHPFGVSINVGAEVTPSSLRGSWHWYELMNDLSKDGALRMKFWIDGELKMDYTEPLPNQGLTMGALRVGDVFNAPVTNSRDWTDEIAVSTHCIAPPW